MFRCKNQEVFWIAYADKNIEKQILYFENFQFFKIKNSSRLFKG